MRNTGCTVLAYRRIYHDLLRYIRNAGYTTVRFISHDQTCRYRGGDVLWTPWMQIAKEVCNTHDFEMHCTLSPKSIPLDLLDESTGQPNDWPAYTDWLFKYFEQMLIGNDRRTLLLEVGNEFESSVSRWTEQGHLRLWDSALAARDRFLEVNRNYTIRLGGVAHVDARQRGRYERMLRHMAPSADFVSIHVYGPIRWLIDAVETARAETDAPVFVTECGPDWRQNPEYEDRSRADAWYQEYSERLDEVGASRSYMLHAWQQLSAPDYLCVMRAGRMQPTEIRL